MRLVSTILAPRSLFIGPFHRHFGEEGHLEHLRGVKAEKECRYHEDGLLESSNVAEKGRESVHFPLVFVHFS